VLVLGLLGFAAVRTTEGSSSQTAEPVSPGSRFPAPPKGAVVFSRQLGGHALALGVVPLEGAVHVQASVVDGQGEGESGLPVSFAAGGSKAEAEPCGPGCYRATLHVRRPQAVDVEVGGKLPAHWHVALPAAWPPRSGSGLLAGADRAWRSLDSLAFSEVLASDAEHVTRSTWRVQAPDRLAYQVQGGNAGIVIGKRRWDRAPGGRWKGSPQTPVTQPVPFWAAAANAHVLGPATVRGKPAWRVSFFDPKSRAWFVVALERGTLRTLDLRMTATAHFMHDVYGSFDSAPPIRPPA
jgi:hypothetical protein